MQKCREKAWEFHQEIRGTTIKGHNASFQQPSKTDLAFSASYKDGTSASRELH